MKYIALYFALSGILNAASIPSLTVADTINPGTADYIMANIEKAESSGAPALLIVLDTPGGLLNSTRSIVQSMLNAKIPIIVFVAPKGAQAGSAGALITFAADIAVMAPGTNIGAAHPVSTDGKDSASKTLDDKITNDTAAFAEGLAKSKGRNVEFAIKAVKESQSITSDKALQTKVIDMIAEDTSVLQQQLSGFVLNKAKGSTKELPKDIEFVPVEMTIKQRFVSFFSNPNVAYLIMSFAGLCIWVELTHPGLIIPGVLGGISIILSLIAFQMLPISYGALGFMLLGLGLLIAEAFLPSFGVVGISGIACFLFGSLFLMDTHVPEFQLSLSVVLPTVAVLAVSALMIGYLVAKATRRKVTSGAETLDGDLGVVRETVTERAGLVFVQGELWNAVAGTGMPIHPGTKVKILHRDGMTLTVEPSDQ